MSRTCSQTRSLGPNLYLCLTLCLCLTSACSQALAAGSAAPTRLGGYLERDPGTPELQPEIQQARDLFDHAHGSEGFVLGDLLRVSTQVVAGMNFRFVFAGTRARKSVYVLVKMYRDLRGGRQLTDFQVAPSPLPPLDLGLMGSYSRRDPGDPELQKEARLARALFRRAHRGEGFVLGATWRVYVQLVAGMNNCFLFQGSKDGRKAPIMVKTYRDLKGRRQVTGYEVIDPFPLEP